MGDDAGFKREGELLKVRLRERCAYIEVSSITRKWKKDITQIKILWIVRRITMFESDLLKRRVSLHH